MVRKDSFPSPRVSWRYRDRCWWWRKLAAGVGSEERNMTLVNSGGALNDEDVKAVGDRLSDGRQSMWQGVPK